MLQSDYQAFVNQRDSQMSFVGSKSETSCNLMFQLHFNSKNNQFELKLRKDIGGFKDADDKFVYGRVYLNIIKEKLKRPYASIIVL